MQHSFDIDVAEKYGLTEAILLNNLQFWIEKNRANNDNFFDGNYWTYNSIEAYTKLFPYLSARKITNAFKKLEDLGIIITGNYNKIAYDRKKWYAITKAGYSISQNQQIQYAETQNRICKNVEPIADSKPNSKPDSKPDRVETKSFTAPTLEEIQSYIFEMEYYMVIAEVFFLHYKNCDWKVGKRKMKSSQDWKDTVTRWEFRDRKEKPQHTSNKNIQPAGVPTGPLEQWELDFQAELRKEGLID